MIHRSFAKISVAGFLLLSASGFTALVSAQTTSSQMDGLKLSNDQPIQIESDKLEVRGYIGIEALGRTQTWIRQ